MSEKIQTLKLILKEGVKINSIHHLKDCLDGGKVKNIKLELIDVIAEEIHATGLMDRTTAASLIKNERQAETSRQSTKRYKDRLRLEELKREKLYYQELVKEMQLECEIARLKCVKLQYELESNSLRDEINTFRMISYNCN